MAHNGTSISKVLLYLRVSKDEQRREGFSIETQRDRCLAKCTEIYGPGGFEAHEIVDDESGAYGLEKTGVAKKTRPGFRKAAELLRDGSFDALVVYRIDRFARSLRWLLQFLEDVLVPTNTELISATEDINTKSAGGMLNLHMLGLMAAWQRQSIADRNRDAAAKRREEGYTVGQVGYGWQWEPISESRGRGRRGILPVPDHGQWIKKIVEWYLGGWSSDRVAYELNTLGVPTPSGKARWHIKAVLKIVANPLNAGLVPAGDRLIEGRHFQHRYYDPETYYRLQEERKGRMKWRTNTQHSQKHLLAGILGCAICGKKERMAISTGPYRSYRCPGEPSPEGDRCRRAYLNADLIEEVVVSEVKALAESPEMQAIAAEEARRQLGTQDEALVAERDQLRQTLSKLQGQFSRWADALTNETMTEQQFREFNAELIQRRADCEARLSEVEASVADRDRREHRLDDVLKALGEFPRVWKHLHFDERRHLLKLVIEIVTAEREGLDITVRLKVHLLPEKVIHIRVPSAKDLKTKPKGVDGLTPRQLAFLKHIAEGLTKKEIAVLMEVGVRTVETFMSKVRDHMGMHDLSEVAKLAMPRIRSTLPFLPTQGRANKGSLRASAELSDKLREILPYVASGATNPEIARLTGLKESTVAGRRARLLDFFEAKSAYEIGQRARAMGLL